MCLQWKVEIQGDGVPTQKWKDAALGLKLSGDYDVSWQACREKFQQLKETFLTTMLPVKGVMYETKWPYYGTLCDIFDVPEDIWKILHDEELEGLQQEDDEYEENYDNDENDENDDPGADKSSGECLVLLLDSILL